MAELKSRSIACKFSRRGLWTLFLMAAFPTHLWTLILIMRDFSWLTERTNIWDAFGVGAYGLLIALAESIFVFVAALALSLLTPGWWEENKRIALLFIEISLVAVWSISNQLYFILGTPFPEFIMRFTAGTAHPLRTLYVTFAILIAPTIIIPTFLVSKSQKIQTFITCAIERLSLLSEFYLSLDIVALAIVVIRNLKGLL